MHREIEISIFTDDVILGEGVGSLMTFDDEGEGVENGQNIDDVIYGLPL